MAVIRTLKEPKIKKKKINLDRLIYFGLIAILIFFIVKYCYNKLAFIEGNGQILMDKVDVNFTQDIRIQDINIQEGDSVAVNQALFSYKQSTFDNDASLILQAQKAQENIAKNAQKLALEIQQKYIKLNALLERLQYIKSTEKQLIKYVLLDVYTKDKLDAVQLEIQQNEVEVKLLQNEIYLLNKQKQIVNTSHTNYTTSIANNSNNNTYTSPINGVIGQILKNEKESCYKTENVMTIHNTDVVFIKAYFSLKVLEHIKQGSIIDVRFPDNSVSKGIINKVYIATYEAPEEFQKTYEPTERNILAEIIPINDVQKSQWATYHKLNIKLEISKI